MPTVDPNAVILTGENPFIRLSATDGGPNTTEASFWRITFSPGATGMCSTSRASSRTTNCASMPTISPWPAVAIDGARHAHRGNGRPPHSRH